MTTLSTASDASPPSLLRQLVLAWVPFSLGMALTILVSVIADDVPHARAQYSIWLALALAAPALFFFARDFGRRELGPLWRLYWTFALAAYLFHLWYGYEIMFAGDWSAVVASQGALTAYANVVVTVLWILDVVSAWVGAAGAVARILRIAAHAGVLVAGLLSTVLFFRDMTAVVVAVLLVLGAAGGVFERLRGR